MYIYYNYSYSIFPHIYLISKCRRGLGKWHGILKALLYLRGRGNSSKTWIRWKYGYTVIGDNLISQLVLYRNFAHSYDNENHTILMRHMYLSKLSPNTMHCYDSRIQILSIRYWSIFPLARRIETVTYFEEFDIKRISNKCIAIESSKS